MIVDLLVTLFSPSYAFQPLAFAGLIVVLLLQKNRPDKKTLQAGLFFTAGVAAMYIALLLIPLTAPFIMGLQVYVSLSVYFVILLLGLQYVAEFFQAKGAAFRADIQSGINQLASLQRTPVPLWWFLVAGLAVGILEPLRLGAYQQRHLFELLTHGDIGSAVALSGYVLLATVPLFIVVLLHRYHAATLPQALKKTSSHKLLLGSFLIALSWLLVLLTAGFAPL